MLRSNLLFILISFIFLIGCSPVVTNTPESSKYIISDNRGTTTVTADVSQSIPAIVIDKEKTTGSNFVEKALQSTVLIFSTNQLEMEKAKTNFWDGIELIKPVLTQRRVTNYPDIFRRTWKQGSGVIIDKRGYILTSRYAIEDCDKPCDRYISFAGSGAQLIYVFIPENGRALIERGHEYIATVICKHPQDDLAIIKISPRISELPYIPLGDSDTIIRGKHIFAIGYPSDILYLDTESAYKWKSGEIDFGCEPTITDGIISAKNKIDTYPLNHSMDELYADYTVKSIQTNAELNWGSSGGPLINESGELIGIAAAKIFSNEGLGSAIEINEAKNLVKAAMARPIEGIPDGAFLSCDDNGYCCSQTSWEASPARRCQAVCDYSKCQNNIYQVSSGKITESQK